MFELWKSAAISLETYWLLLMAILAVLNVLAAIDTWNKEDGASLSLMLLGIQIFVALTGFVFL